MIIFSLNIILGIVLGLYLKSIALLFFIVYLILLFNLKNLLKIFTKKDENGLKEFFLRFNKIIKIGVIICFFTTIFVVFIDYKYENLYSELSDCVGVAEVVSFKEEKEYKNKYIFKIKYIDSNKKYRNTKLLIYTSKDIDLKYGDIVSFSGNFEKASSKRNSKGFDYERYLRQSKIYGIININELKILENKKSVLQIIFNFRNNLKQKLFETFDKNQASFLAGILLGDKSDISSDILEDFKNSNLSHILAISGLHIIYVENRDKFYFR